MDAVTSRRRNGTARRYQCRTHRERPQDCSAQPIDATLVDHAVIENLQGFLGDAEKWRDRIQQGRDAERDRMACEVERAEAALADEERRLAKRTAEWERWVDADDPVRADISMGAVIRSRTAQKRAQNRLQAAQDAFTAVDREPERDPNDALTDRLHAELSGRIKDAHGDVKRLNAVMREYFEGMDLLHRDEGRVEIRPVLRPAQLQRFLDHGDFPEGVVASENNPHTPT